MRRVGACAFSAAAVVAAAGCSPEPDGDLAAPTTRAEPAATIWVPQFRGEVEVPFDWWAGCLEQFPEVEVPDRPDVAFGGVVYDDGEERWTIYWMGPCEICAAKILESTGLCLDLVSPPVAFKSSPGQPKAKDWVLSPDVMLIAELEAVLAAIPQDVPNVRLVPETGGCAEDGRLRGRHRS